MPRASRKNTNPSVYTECAILSLENVGYYSQFALKVN